MASIYMPLIIYSPCILNKSVLEARSNKREYSDIYQRENVNNLLKDKLLRYKESYIISKGSITLNQVGFPKITEFLI